MRIVTYNIRGGVGMDGRRSIARMSAVPVRRQRMHPLPGEGERRAALEVALEMEGRPLTLFCTHFGLSEAARAVQAASLAAAVKRLGGPVVVLGDLNAGPESPELQQLLAAGLRYAAPPLEATYPAYEP